MSKSRLSALAGYRAGFLPNPTLAMHTCRIDRYSCTSSSVTRARAGSGFSLSGSFVSGFPTARLGFTLRRGHEATEHLSTKGTWVPPFLGLVCLSIHVDHLEDDRGAGWGPAREGDLTLDRVSSASKKTS